MCNNSFISHLHMRISYNYDGGKEGKYSLDLAGHRWVVGCGALWYNLVGRQRSSIYRVGVIAQQWTNQHSIVLDNNSSVR